MGSAEVQAAVEGGVRETKPAKRHGVRRRHAPDDTRPGAGGLRSARRCGGAGEAHRGKRPTERRACPGRSGQGVGRLRRGAEVAGHVVGHGLVPVRLGATWRLCLGLEVVQGLLVLQVSLS